MAVATVSTPQALGEHYAPSATLNHVLLAQSNGYQLWRTVAKRDGFQPLDRVDFQILDDGEWVASHSRESGARLLFQALSIRLA